MNATELAWNVNTHPQAMIGRDRFADAAFLVCNSADELVALGLVDSMQSAEKPLRVVPSAHVPSSSWYLLADPSDFPAICRATLAGSSDSIWAERQDRKSSDLRYDGVGIRLAHACGYAPVSRTGIVRCDKS